MRPTKLSYPYGPLTQDLPYCLTPMVPSHKTYHTVLPPYRPLTQDLQYCLTPMGPSHKTYHTVLPPYRPLTQDLPNCLTPMGPSHKTYHTVLPPYGPLTQAPPNLIYDECTLVQSLYIDDYSVTNFYVNHCPHQILINLFMEVWQQGGRAARPRGPS